MAFALGPKAISGGYRLAAYDTIGSTSTEALERAAAGDPGRLWVVSREQTAGHGRRGRLWETAGGNLAASLLMRLSAPQHRAATLGFAAGLALEDAIRTCAPAISMRMAVDGAQGPSARLRLKWPNDVLIDGAKIAGILLQAASGPSGSNNLVIGIGVNVLHAPERLPYPTTSLAAWGARVTAERLFEALSDAWTGQEAAWDGGGGFAAIRDHWLERAAGLGRPIAVHLGADVFRGTFETIDEEGRLVVRAADGSTKSFAAGEAHFGAAATAGR